MFALSIMIKQAEQYQPQADALPRPYNHNFWFSGLGFDEVEKT